MTSIIEVVSLPEEAVAPQTPPVVAPPLVTEAGTLQTKKPEKKDELAEEERVDDGEQTAAARASQLRTGATEDTAVFKLLKRTQCFKNKTIEDGYRDFFLELFTESSRIGMLALLTLAVTVFMNNYVAVSDRCYRCSERLFVGLTLVLIAATSFIYLGRVIFGGVLLFSQEFLYLVCSLVLSLVVLLQSFYCPSSLSYKSVGNDYAQLSDQYFPVLLQLQLTILHLHFSSAIWPDSSIFVTIAAIVQVVAVSVSYSHLVDYPLIIGLVIGGTALAYLSAALTSWERRTDFATGILLGKELQVLAAEKEATTRLAKALFPPDIAKRLIRRRGNNSESPGTTPGLPMSSPSKSPSSAPLSNSVNHDDNDSSSGLASTKPEDGSSGTASARKAKFVSDSVIADSYPSATVVIATFDGIETVQPFDAQLTVLSQLFIAADHVATTHRAVTIKPIGTSLVFGCGVSGNAIQSHIEQACALSIDLMRMLHAYHGQQRFATEVTLRIGIATGPVAAGVVGLSRPRYDVFGYTVSVAEKLAQTAAPGTVVTTREVATEMKARYNFRLLRDVKVVAGIGKLLLFKLQLPQLNSAAAQLPIKTEPDSFVSPKTDMPVTTLAEMTKSKREQAHFTMSRTLRFKSRALENRFLQVYTERFSPHTRWVSLVSAALMALCLIYQLYLDYSGHSYRATNRRSHGFELASCGVLLVPFVISWIKPIVKRPKLFWGLVFASGVIVLALQLFLWDMGLRADPTLSPMLIFFAWIHYCKLPFRVAFPISLVMTLLSFPMYSRIGFIGGTGVIQTTTLLVFYAAHLDLEFNARKSFVTGVSIDRSRRLLSEQRDMSQALLTSVLPRKLLNQLLDPTTSTTTHLADFVPSATVLVISVVGFDELTKKLPPRKIVEVLNTLFSHFDRIAVAHGCEPLKTIGDEYCVVGNSLHEMEADHASRLVALAVDILSTLKGFNDEYAETFGFALSLKLGVHTGPVLSGVIRMKSFMHDIWGDAIPVTKQICSVAPPNVVTISATTRSLLTQQFATIQPLYALQFDSGELPLFAVFGDSVQLQSFSLDQSASTQMETPRPQQQQSYSVQMQPRSSTMSLEDGTAMTPTATGFAVYTGTGDSVTREYALANGFVPVEEPSGPAGDSSTSSQPQQL